MVVPVKVVVAFGEESMELSTEGQTMEDTFHKLLRVAEKMIRLYTPKGAAEWLTSQHGGGSAPSSATTSRVALETVSEPSLVCVTAENWKATEQLQRFSDTEESNQLSRQVRAVLLVRSTSGGGGLSVLRYEDLLGHGRVLNSSCNASSPASSRSPRFWLMCCGGTNNMEHSKEVLISLDEQEAECFDTAMDFYRYLLEKLGMDPEDAPLYTVRYNMERSLRDETAAVEIDDDGDLISFLEDLYDEQPSSIHVKLLRKRNNNTASSTKKALPTSDHTIPITTTEFIERPVSMQFAFNPPVITIVGYFEESDFVDFAEAVNKHCIGEARLGNMKVRPGFVKLPERSKLMPVHRMELKKFFFDELQQTMLLLVAVDTMDRLGNYRLVPADATTKVDKNILEEARDQRMGALTAGNKKPEALNSGVHFLQTHELLFIPRKKYIHPGY